MKFVRFNSSNGAQIGVLLGEQIVNLTAAVPPYAAAKSGAFLADGADDMLSWLLAVSRGAAQVQEIITWAQETRQPAFLTQAHDADFALPIARPGKIVCVGLNYADHCREQDVPIPTSPILFTKFTSALLPHGGEIRWSPALTQQVDYEAELAVIIGRQARHVKAADALAFVAGYTIANDVSARNLQFADGQWIRGKSLDTFCPIGPIVTTAGDIPDPHNLAIQCRVNGRPLQDSNTYEMIFKIPALIEFISSFCTLYPGDLILTGTPHGVGVFRDPQVFLQPGDVVEVEIERIGVLRNPVGDAV